MDCAAVVAHKSHMLIRRIRREQPDLQRAPHELRAVGGARLLEETRHVPSRVRVRVRVGVGVGAGVGVRVRVRVRVRDRVRARDRVWARLLEWRCRCAPTW